MQRDIKLIRFITLRYADPICAIDLSDKYLLYGTMLGTAACYLINQKKLITLSETQEEHISGVKIQDDQKENKLYVCVGDEKILIYNSINENDDNIKQIEKGNYQSENEHFQKCEKSFTMLKNDYLVRTFIEFPPDTKTSYNVFDTQVSIKNIINSIESEKTEIIKMSNYCVPHDFDGKNYIFVDFIEEKNRIFYIYDLDNNNIRKKVELDKEKIGHISLCKILNDELIFLVRSYNICEIRDFNFNLKRYFNYNGNEILAFDIIYTDENNFDSLKIIILDLNCNVFLYHYKNDKLEYWFNLENLNIEQVIKDQRFFSMGYPYYIKVSKQYLAISSDYGCLLLQHSPL